MLNDIRIPTVSPIDYFPTFFYTLYSLPGCIEAEALSQMRTNSLVGDEIIQQSVKRGFIPRQVRVKPLADFRGKELHPDCGPTVLADVLPNQCLVYRCRITGNIRVGGIDGSFEDTTIDEIRKRTETLLLILMSMLKFHIEPFEAESLDISTYFTCAIGEFAAYFIPTRTHGTESVTLDLGKSGGV